jgi:hypothetical protein
MSAAFLGLDLTKSVFQVHGVDIHGKVVVTKRLWRDAVLTFFANLPPCVVGLIAGLTLVAKSLAIPSGAQDDRRDGILGARTPSRRTPEPMLIASF